jgi:hypothetical protein
MLEIWIIIKISLGLPVGQGLTACVQTTLFRTNFSVVISSFLVPEICESAFIALNIFISHTFWGVGAEYTVNNVNGTKSIQCTKKNFENINVAAGVDKQCWCDEDQRQMKPKVVQQVKQYWRTQLIKKEEEEAIAEARR